MTVISYAGGADIAPDQTDIATAAFISEPRTVVHDILDGPPVYTLRPADPRTGILRLGFTTEQAALDCFESHRIPSVFTVSSTESIALNFAYIVAGGRVSFELDRETGRLWTVEVPYQEVLL